MQQAVHRYVPEIRLLLEERLKLKGPSLTAQIGKVGRRLPKALIRDLRRIAEAETVAEAPKLAMQIDEADIAARAERVISHLKGIDPRQVMFDKVLFTTAKFSAVLIGLFIAAVWIAHARGLV